MKGGTISVGISSGARSTAGRSMGASLSPEARFGGSSKPAFSSRGLSMFNREAISRPSSSIGNINHGHETKSSFARTQSLAAKQSLFDVSRPFTKSSIVSHERKAATSPTIININHGREAVSKVARTQSLEPKRGMLDIARPISVMPKVESTHKTVAARTKEVGLNPQNRAERVKSVDAFRNTIVLWQAKDRTIPSTVKDRVVGAPRVSRERTIDVTRAPRISSVRETLSRVRTEVAKPKTEVRTSIKTLVSERVKVVNQATLSRAIELDTLHAEKMVNLLRAVTPQLTELQAQRSLVKVLLRKYEGKAGVVVLPETKTETQSEVKQNIVAEAAVIVEKGVKLQAQPRTETKEQKMKVGKQKTPVEEEKLYFVKDEKANSKRVKRVLEAVHRITNRKKDEKVTGLEIDKEISNGIEKEEYSELTRLQQFDHRLFSFRRAIKNIQEVEGVKHIGSIVKILADYYSAVKLSHEQDQAHLLGADAIEVYGGPLADVDAYVEDEFSNGKLMASAISHKVRVIRRGQEQIYQGVAESEDNQGIGTEQ